MMKHRILLLLKIFLAVFLFSVFSRVFFLLYNWSLTKEAGSEAFLTFWHGLRLDISVTSYLIALPILIVLISSIFKRDLYTTFIKWYLLIVLIILSFVLVVDLELYKFWGFRLDTTSALYLKTPKEALASVSVWIILRQFIIAVIVFFVSFKLFKRIIRKEDTYKFSYIEIGVYALLLASLIIPIRGGVGIAPINAGSAYFSQNAFVNHASINVYWNLGNSLSNNSKKSQYKFFEESEALKYAQPYLNNGDTEGLMLLKEKRPNIILIMLESFTANVVEPLGGLRGITPNLNKLSKEGIFFTHMYCSADRSEKGLVSILSGFPAQPSFSVIKDAAVTQSFPKIPLDLKKLGYNSAFYYGGDLNFANMKSYLITAGFSEFVSQDDFPPSTYNSKWGAHDEVVFQRLLTDLDKAQTPFFKMLFTLSSHEPFEVPLQKISGDDELHKFLNSVYYTDSCLGKFIQAAKNKKWWSNTLIIMVADHGIRWPDNLKAHEPAKFHIPMLWLGGAIDTTMQVNKIVSQVDIAVSLLNQLGVKGEKYKYSRNVFGNTPKTGAFYVYNNGIGMINDTMKLVYDFEMKAVLKKQGKISNDFIKTSKAYIQEVYNDIGGSKK
jgi:phosphoglycerol transferase MdoB-like AlkP superfamily enzyme